MCSFCFEQWAISSTNVWKSHIWTERFQDYSDTSLNVDLHVHVGRHWGSFTSWDLPGLPPLTLPVIKDRVEESLEMNKIRGQAFTHRVLQSKLYWSHQSAGRCLWMTVRDAVTIATAGRFGINDSKGICNHSNRRGKCGVDGSKGIQ